jgi:hypothetical protein
MDAVGYLGLTTILIAVLQADLQDTLTRAGPQALD